MLLFDGNKILYELELWRMLTNFLFFGMFGMPFVFNMFFLVRYSQSLEESRFHGKAADYIWCLAVCATVLLGFALALDGLPVLSSGLLSSIVYLWSRNAPTQPVSIFGMFTVQAFYFPWALALITMLMGGSPLLNILGILAGHVYFFLRDVQGWSLSAPAFLRDVLDDMPQAPDAAHRGMFGGYNWGGGRRLAD